MAEQGGISWPPYAYVPGLNARHPEGYFDAQKADVKPGMSPRNLAESRAFAIGRAYFDAGFFWECHEVLEAVWLVTTPASPEREIVQALIQLANARLKLLMERPKAALRLCDIVEAHIAQLGGTNLIMGVEQGALLDELRQTRSAAKAEI
ncbi:DUF309 domain-containing protein [Sulfitobacter sp. SK012]|uniref:DUF309 domain-containing protein n=1 Tax=Sulfitobacter sp. SK012 TaxID=1389005 RepID=UPI0020C7D669|nr:DUF309 domain-containing protein [Sulfitobacter sp. SK012]